MKMIYTAISRQGLREQNEDSIYPAPGQVPAQDVNLFMVCDGVGGGASGEVASQLTCTAIAAYFEQQVKDKESGGQEVNAAVQQAETMLEAYKQQHPDSHDMATTLALLHSHAGGITIAHIGDSRVYHIRNGHVIFCTHDHTLVNEFVTSGYLTEEEAAHHPKRNVITRAITGASEPVTADVQIVQQVVPGDHFLLCSDGVWQCLDRQFIQEYFDPEAIAEGHTPAVILQKIDEICSVHSADNYSAIIVQVIL
jgi:protein phosphatase